MYPASSIHGFTLLEIMVALCIFTIISTASYFMLDGLFTAQSRVENSSDRLVELQRWLIISERDMMQMAPAVLSAPTDSDTDSKEQALSYNADPLQLTFSRRGWSNPLGYKRSELQRVEYRLDHGQLVRYSIPMLPLTGSVGKEKKPLLLHVNAASAQFLDQTGQWQGGWTPPPEHMERLPRAIDLSVDIEGVGAVQLLFPIAYPTDATH